MVGTQIHLEDRCREADRRPTKSNCQEVGPIIFPWRSAAVQVRGDVEEGSVAQS